MSSDKPNPERETSYFSKMEASYGIHISKRGEIEFESEAVSHSIGNDGKLVMSPVGKLIS
ncbi:hypothetical protein [Aquidulcibacter paucihalophilus]|uniref:hypothetical protein n=1 Tax=Aquidulcibacter paucihalophilus TaxID=1978549 RepID=UPI0012FF7B56|nr:hypothetical protein [Aquidulcibacter paucihalophilus]